MGNQTSTSEPYHVGDITGSPGGDIGVIITIVIVVIALVIISICCRCAKNQNATSGELGCLSDPDAKFRKHRREHGSFPR